MFDSGVGGLTVLRALRDVLPAEDFIYLGDTARLPYGTKSPATVSAYACQASRLLVERGVKALVVACNTASAFALQDLRRQFPDIPVFGVVEPGATAAASAAGPAGIVILATESTIRGGAYQRALLQRVADVPIYGRSCPLWVTLAEMGTRSVDLVQAIVANDLRGFLRPSQNPLTVLLGCTHFPVFKETIQSLFDAAGEEVQVVDSATTTAAAVKTQLHTARMTKTGDTSGSIQLLATDGAERFSQVGQQFLFSNPVLSSVELVDL